MDVRLANAKAFCAIGLTPSYLSHVRTRPTTRATDSGRRGYGPEAQPMVLARLPFSHSRNCPTDSPVRAVAGVGEVSSHPRGVASSIVNAILTRSCAEVLARVRLL